MCIYARTVFECKHHVWGRRLRLCAVGERFRDGILSSDCNFRKSHGLHSRSISQRCTRCHDLDYTRTLLRAALDACWNVFCQTWPEHEADTADAAAEGEQEEQGLELDGSDGESTLNPEIEDQDGHGGMENAKLSVKLTFNAQDADGPHHSKSSSLPRPKAAPSQARHDQKLATIKEA